MKKIKDHIRAFKDCTVDYILSVPELEHEYVLGYENYIKGNRYFSIEHRLTKSSTCSFYNKGCRSKWYGFRTGGISPEAIYKCKHGIITIKLVSRLKY